MLRSAAGTGRAATAIASALPVQAIEAPIATPAPSVTPIMPCAVASSTSPATYDSDPASISGRKPTRVAHAPASGCSSPQARFCTAMATVKSETEMPMSRVSGGMKMPRLWRRPMARLSIREAPSRIGRAGRRLSRREGAVGVGTVVVSRDCRCRYVPAAAPGLLSMR
ncbi:hypothetical protein D3C81_1536140 [compost metagenome]